MTTRSTGTTPAGPGVEALQTALAGEHAAVFVLGFLGAQTSESGSPDLYTALRDAYFAHRDRRDELVALVAARGAVPAAAAPSYQLPDVRTGAPAALAAAGLEVERACGDTYGFVVASTSGPDRAWAVRALLDSARRELTLGGSPRRFPGR